MINCSYIKVVGNIMVGRIEECQRQSRDRTKTIPQGSTVELSCKKPRGRRPQKEISRVDKFYVLFSRRSYLPFDGKAIEVTLCSLPLLSFTTKADHQPSAKPPVKQRKSKTNKPPNRTGKIHPKSPSSETTEGPLSDRFLRMMP